MRNIFDLRYLESVYQQVIQALLDQVDCSERARLRAVATKGADAWLHQNPGMIQDILLPDPAFRDAVCLRLAIVIFEGSAIGHCELHPNMPSVSAHTRLSLQGALRLISVSSLSSSRI